MGGRFWKHNELTYPNQLHQCLALSTWNVLVRVLIAASREARSPQAAGENKTASGRHFFFFSLLILYCHQFTSIHRSVVSDSATLWTVAHQASSSITNSWSLLKLMSIESVMTSNHLILCRPLLLLPSIFPSIRVFSNKSVLHIRWPKYWNFSFSISPSNEYSGLISFRID